MFPFCIIGNQTDIREFQRARGSHVTVYLRNMLMAATEAGFFNNASGKGKPIVADPEERNPHIGE